MDHCSHRPVTMATDQVYPCIASIDSIFPLRDYTAYVDSKRTYHTETLSLTVGNKSHVFRAFSNAIPVSIPASRDFE